MEPIFDLTGLSESEAAQRLKTEGYNELPTARKRTLGRIALEVCGEPMFELLLVASAVYLIVGNLSEGLVLLGSAFVTIVIATIQETRTERVLEALKDLTSPRAQVIRDGVRRRIASREVARGDVIVLEEGDRVPADAILLSSDNLEADESLLTGESVPVRKGASAASSARPGAAEEMRTAEVFSGTMIVRGRGVGHVHATGAASAIGRIGKSLGEIEIEPSPLNRQTRRLVRVLATVGIGLSLLVVLLYRLLRGAWFNGLLAGITLAMSLLPEEFPLVLTIFLVMGAWRISKARVLTRRSNTIETLGAATVLCTDKTGTLTVNQMAVAELLPAGEAASVDPNGSRDFGAKALELVEAAILASEIHPFDPMERALHQLGRRWPALGERRRNWTLVQDYGIGAQLLAMAHVWKTEHSDDLIVAAKGAPEAIAELCQMQSDSRATMLREVDRMAVRGMRVLGVAMAPFDGLELPASIRDFEYQFLGLVGLADPLREGVPQAIRECRGAGIEVAMVTGDYPATAMAIARQAGIDSGSGVVTGDELSRMDEEELCARVKSARVFARTKPEHKLRLVNAFKANGEIVAMTGDGVNDAPSLKAAHIGIAMGGRGTDVAREAAAIVLLDDDFGSIVKAVRLGRRIYDNLRKAMGYLLAVHVPIAGLSLLPIICGWPLIFTPVHIAFLELIIDPVASIVFEAETEESDLMRKPPRKPETPLFSPAMIGWSIFQGAWVLFLTASVFAGALAQRTPESQARALVFASLVTGNLLLIFVNRSFSSSIVVALRRPNAALWLVLAVTALLLAMSLAVPAVRALFLFAPFSAADFILVLAVGIATIALLEPLKAVLRARRLAPA